MLETKFSYHYFTSSVKLGYFIKKNFLAGISFDYAFEQQQSEANNVQNFELEQKISDYTYSPFIRYYFENKLFFQSQVGLGKQFNKQKGTQNSSTQFTDFTNKFENKIQTIGFAIGYTFKLKKRLHIEPILNYSVITGKEDNLGQDSNNSNKLYLNIGISYSI